MSVVDEHAVLCVKDLLDEKLEPLLGEAAHVEAGLTHEGHLIMEDF